MKDKKIKEIAAEMLRNKDQIFRFLGYLRPEDIERGVLIVPDELVNAELRPIILDRSAPHLVDYRLSSTGTSGGIGGPDGMLFLDLELFVKQLGTIKARYMLCISELRFTPTDRRLAFTYREDLKSGGNPLQAMALKAFLGKKTLLMKVAEMAAIPSLGYDSASLDLAKLPLSLPGFLDAVSLSYEGAGEGFLRFHFQFASV